MRVLSVSLIAFALVASTVAAEAPPKEEMGRFVMVLLRPGDPNAPQEPGAQEAHHARMQELMKAGTLLAAGQVTGSDDLFGIGILSVGTVEEAQRLFADDPLFRSGRYRVELHPWMAATGILRPGMPHEQMEEVPFGFLRRPADAPTFSDEKLKELQAGHMANINAMAATGDLVWAGPFLDDGTLRGVLIFRAGTADRVREAVAKDPAVQAGRLALDVVTWSIPKGSFPERPGTAGTAPPPGAPTR